MQRELLCIVFDLEILKETHGYIVLRASGKNTEKVFGNEGGGHRWQRVSPTEKKGRVHTSTVLVAVLEEPTEVVFKVHEKDLRIQTCRGSGAGGQHRNVTDTAVQVTHIPSGLMVRCESERSQMQNKNNAISLLTAKLWEEHKQKEFEKRSKDKKEQFGLGMRGDKRRTIRTQDGIVTDHILNKQWKLKAYLKGEID